MTHKSIQWWIKLLNLSIFKIDVSVLESKIRKIRPNVGLNWTYIIFFQKIFYNKKIISIIQSWKIWKSFLSFRTWTETWSDQLTALLKNSFEFSIKSKTIFLKWSLNFFKTQFNAFAGQSRHINSHNKKFISKNILGIQLESHFYMRYFTWLKNWVELKFWFLVKEHFNMFIFN